MLSEGDGQATIMFANSALARENYRKNETPMCFLHAKTSPVFRFFVGLTIITFAFFTIVPKPLLAQEAATTTEEIINDSSDDPNDQLSIINNDSSATTTTEEIVNDGLSIINDTSSDVATTTEEMATTTEEIINDSSDDQNDQLSIINDDSSDDQNDQLSIINDSSDAATSTEEVVNDQLSIINDLSDGAATGTTATDSLIEIEFTNVYYGQVGEDQETIAPQITSAIVRNVSQTPAAVMLWQDDMGLGRGQDGRWNIQYGARAAGGEWVFYDPFQMVLLPDVLLPGQSAQMEFSVKVFDFPKTGAGAEIDYQGIMTINGVAAPQGEKSLPFLNEILSGDVADSDLKPESGIE